MRTAEVAKLAVSLLAPPRCGACAAPCAAGAPICGPCVAALQWARGGRAPLVGVGEVTWAAPYEGIARELVAGLKFGARQGLAAVAAAALAPLIDCAPETIVVPVPPAPARRRRRGFDAAELLAAQLATTLGLATDQPLRRRNGPRQVGRPRAERMGAPPRIWARGAVPPRALIVDDVLTTGATIRACATALRGAGAAEIRAAAFARAGA